MYMAIVPLVEAPWNAVMSPLTFRLRKALCLQMRHPWHIAFIYGAADSRALIRAETATNAS
ncbi:hypothetical protein VNPA131183_49670 [Pseudomonas aeruginosa]|nr:hypothetical protein VNPA131183_49670 [Pseudomonas aeruginosa]